MMSKIVSVEKVEGEGLTALLGERVLLMCMNYFYEGKLIGVNDTVVMLEDVKIVYDTGAWSAKTMTSAEQLHQKHWYVSIASIESFGITKGV